MSVGLRLTMTSELPLTKAQAFRETQNPEKAYDVWRLKPLAMFYLRDNSPMKGILLIEEIG